MWPQVLVGGWLQRGITKRDVTIFIQVDTLSDPEFHEDSESGLKFTRIEVLEKLFVEWCQIGVSNRISGEYLYAITGYVLDWRL